MTDSQQTTLVLGGTGRTGSLVAQKLIERGLNARTASRHDADVLFDWDDPTTHALEGVDRVYLVTPVMRVRYAGLVSDFLDLAAGAGVRHVTYLSTYGSDQAPPEVDIRAVELDLACRGAFTHSILRPAWVMQNFSDEHVPVIEGLSPYRPAAARKPSSMPRTSRRSRSRRWSTLTPMLARSTRRPALNRSRSATSPISLPT